MKIQLILPHCDNPGSRLIRGWTQPLGLLSIATYLRNQNPNIEIEILDGTILSQQQIESKIDGDILGISAISRAYPNAIRIAKKAKELGARIILGGQYATALGPIILRNRPYIDAVIQYDGEIAFAKYVDGEPYERIENIIYRKPGGTIQKNKIRLCDINNLPIPNRSFLDLSPYDENYRKYVGGPFTRGGTIYSQRGCFWRTQAYGGCVFCAIPDYSWRLRNPTDFWVEVQRLHEKGFQLLYDVSDDIGAKKKWLIELQKTKPQIEIYFKHYLGAKHTDEETVKALLNMGSVEVFIGFESHDDECLSIMNKEASTEDNINTVKILNQFGMPLMASFVGGVAGETNDSLKRTREFARYISELPIAVGIHWDILKPIPGSRAFKMLLETPSLSLKYNNKDLFDTNEMQMDWVHTFCEVDYDYLCSVVEEAENWVPDTATYAPVQGNRQD